MAQEIVDLTRRKDVVLPQLVRRLLAMESPLRGLALSYRGHRPGIPDIARVSYREHVRSSAGWE